VNGAEGEVGKKGMQKRQKVAHRRRKDFSVKAAGGFTEGERF
jgi:hypothetical protein